MAKTALDIPRSKVHLPRCTAPPPPAGDTGESLLPDRTKKPLIIPIFIMNRGCPQRCVFCNEKIAAGNFSPEITRSFFDAEVASYLRRNRDRKRSVEIAFYGGSFTGLPEEEQTRLLAWGNAYIRQGRVAAMRISARPDQLHEKELVFLHAGGVRTIEIGAQSFNDRVLHQAGRGHDAQAIVRAVRCIHALGLKSGLHLMAGLPGDTKESFLQTLARTVELRPDTARIHPVLVFRDTPLAEEFRAGRYRPLSLEEAIDWCRLAWETLVPAGISIIRFGLQTTPEMLQEGAVTAGPWHPSFGSLVYSAVFYAAMEKLLGHAPRNAKMLRFAVADCDQSHSRGYGGKNIEAIKTLYPDAQIIIDSDPKRDPGHLSLETETGKTVSARIPGIL
ncbi:MAG TPA: radical SAM protein [Smithellaceae bacterium]|nr:radical SAM protein [Smithellaceae bacterium]HRV45799.1 radical SAM protein [Smithellaceae bacterium]